MYSLFPVLRREPKHVQELLQELPKAPQGLEALVGFRVVDEWYYPAKEGRVACIEILPRGDGNPWGVDIPMVVVAYADGTRGSKYLAHWALFTWYRKGAEQWLGIGPGLRWTMPGKVDEAHMLTWTPPQPA